MKKLIILVMIVAVVAAFYVEGSSPSGLWLKVVAIVIFMFGMMWLSSKTPSKNKDENQKDV